MTDDLAALTRFTAARLDALGDRITKLLEDIRDGFWRGIDKLLYG